jgi:nitrogen fixation protein FixH
MTSSSPGRRCDPWPITIIAFFALFISFLASFIVFASRQHVDLVREDYYEEELRFQQQLDRVKRTQGSGQSASVAYSADQHCIAVRLPFATAENMTGRIHLYRPSDAKLDCDWPLIVDSQGQQRLDASQLQAGLWRVRVQWLRNGQEYYCDQAVVVPHRPIL